MMLRVVTAGMTLRLSSVHRLPCCAASPGEARAAPATECTTVGLCYCVNADFRPAIDEKVAYFRRPIAAESAKGKAIGYLSVPLSTSGGSYFGVNREVAKHEGAHRSAVRRAAVWVLDPTAKDADLPTLGGVRARQGDYMLMWTRVLEGTSGLGEEFDFIYFAGPADFAGYFGLDGKGDMDQIEAYFDDRLAKDADFKKAVDAGRVIAQPSATTTRCARRCVFSAGAHDEWNVIRLVNNRRRDDAKFGVGNQLPVLFDGRAVSTAELEQPVAAGNVGACKP